MTCNNIKINIRLCAYAKGFIPDCIAEVPDDGRVYGRVYKEWKALSGEYIPQYIELLHDNSGLLLVKDEATGYDILSIDQQFLEHYPTVYDNSTMYYITDNGPNTYINCGTSVSFNDTGVYQTIDGGTSSTVDFDVEFIPINSKGKGE